MPPIDEAFSPPTPEQVTDHLQQHPLRGPSKLQAWIPIIGFGLVLLLVIIVETGPALLLPWFLILALMFYSGALAAHIRRLHQQVTAVQELAMLRHYPQSLRLAWRTLPKVTGLPEHYLRLCALMSANLGQVQAHESALVLLDQLIERLPDDHPGSVQLRLQRVMAELATDRMLDADQSLRKLRDPVRELAKSSHDEPALAVYRFAELYQAARTLRDEDVVQQCASLMDDLRPLGVEAGYGYALAALGHYRLIQRKPEQTQSLLMQAQGWWHKATLLVPAQLLVQRLPELRDMHNDPNMQAVQMQTTPPVVVV